MEGKDVQSGHEAAFDSPTFRRRGTRTAALPERQNSTPTHRAARVLKSNMKYRTAKVAPQKTLADPAARRSIELRLAVLSPNSARCWGKMSANQMLCHLADSYRAVIGEKKLSPFWLPLPRSLLKFAVLYLPWMKGAPTRPEVKQGVGGTPPVDFESDRRKLIETIDRFCSAPASARGIHPMMGNLTYDEWMRWGYLHADHHLRQFGV
jgi:hypothetical protein